MRMRHMRGIRGGLPATVPAAMRGDAPSFEEHLDDGRGEPDLDALVQELVGDAVVVVRDGDVVVDVDARVAPLGELIAGSRERAQQRAVELLEEGAARDAELAHQARVQRGKQVPDGRVQLSDAEELAMAEGGEDPPLNDEHIGLDDGLVTWMARPGRHDGGAVVLRKLQVSAVDDRLVATGLRDAAAEIVGHEDRRRAAEELHHPDMRGDPRGEILGQARLGVHVAARAQHADEQLHGDHFARRDVDDRRTLAREVHEGLLTGAVDLAHGGRQRAGPLVVMPAELAVPVPVGMVLQIFEVQPLERDPWSLELAVDPGHVGQGSGHTDEVADPLEQPGLELGVVPLGRQRPAQGRLLSPAAVLGHRAQPHATRPGDRPVGQALLVLQSKDLANLPHR